MIGDKHVKVVLRQNYLCPGQERGIQQVSHSSFLTSEKSL